MRSWRPTHSGSYRWLPSQGRAMSVIEHISQRIVKILAWFPIYIGLVGILTLVVTLLRL